jgi:putative membrane protein
MVLKQLVVTVATGVLALGAAAPVRAAPAEPVPADERACQEDVKYLVRAHRGNLAELSAGTVALTRSRNGQVRRLAGMLVHDHLRFDMRVVGAAGRHDVALPPKPTRQQRADLAAVIDRPGPEFDRAWLTLQEAAHLTTLDHIDRHQRDGCAADVTALSAAARKPVETHLAAARRALADLPR